MGIYSYLGNSIETVKCLEDYGNISTPSGFASAMTSFLNDTVVKTVIIPPGSYRITSPIAMKSNKTIYGDNATIIGNDNMHIFTFDNISNVSIKNLNIDMGQSASSTRGDAFNILDSSDIVIQNITITNLGCRGSLVYCQDATTGRNTRIVFDNVTFFGIGERSAGSEEWPTGIIAVNCVDCTIKNCKAYNLIGFTLEFKNYCSNCRVSNNLIKGGRRGINLGSDLHGTVEGCTFENIVMNDNIVINNAFPLCIGKVKNSVISGNYLSGRSNLIVDCHSVMISGNYFNGELSDITAYQNALFHINDGSDIYLTNNVYDRGEIEELFYIQNSPENIIFQGIFEGTEIDIVNPQSGTPTVS